MKVGDRVKDKLYERGLGTVTKLVTFEHPSGAEQCLRYCAMIRWDNPQPDFCTWFQDQYISAEHLDDVEVENGEKEESK